MSLLYRSVDAYICTSSCEGLNLPLIEAISNHCPVISPLHTSMLSFLDQHSCTTIQSNTAVVRPDASCLGESFELDWQSCSVDNITSTIRSFHGLSKNSRKDKANKAYHAISSRFNIDQFQSSLAAIDLK